MTGLRHLLGIAALLVILLPAGSNPMEPMSESEMDGVQARSGIAFAVSDAKIYRHSERLALEDTSSDQNRVEYGNITSYYSFQNVTPMSLRVFQNDHGLPLVGMEALPGGDRDALDMSVTLRAGSYTFCGQNMGKMAIEDYGMAEFALYMSPSEALEGVDRSGVAFQLETRASMEALRWNYQNGENNDGSFVLDDLRLARSFDAEGNPEGRFNLGHLDARDENGGSLNPAMFQVLQDDTGDAFVRMQLPMQGSLRVEDVQMGEHDYLGPIRIENMEVHHMQVDFIPN